MTDNLAVWNKLSRTDPDHTKAFTRGGGFRGTAIKPIYTEMKMTETFGPCGAGWGYSEPHFQLVNCAGGEVAVFCWLNLWYRKEDGSPSDPIPGVGGDFVVKTLKGELRSDDEAFKKAATDALGNAMKHLGMSADVHMGQFDDNKYVAELREDKAANGKRTRVEISAEADRKRRDLKSVTDDILQLDSLAQLERYQREELTPEFMSALGMKQYMVEQALETRRIELTKDEEAEGPTKTDYIRQCHDIINEHASRDALLTWWNDKTNKTKRGAMLTPDERRWLMDRVEERGKEIGGSRDPKKLDVLDAG